MEIIEVEGFKGKGRFRNKTQIVLTHTGRPLNYYMNSLKKRYNGKYDKIPHYIISKDGKIFQLLEQIRDAKAPEHRFGERSIFTVFNRFH